MIAATETPEDKSYRIIDLRGGGYGDGWNDSPARGPAGVRITPETALQCSTVLACVRLIAENVATVPLHLYERLTVGGKERARSVPLYRLLNQQPNGWQTSFEFREMLTAHCLLYGNAYAEIRSGSAGAVSELWPLHPSRMKVEQLEDGTLRYCYREQNGRETIYRQDQIFTCGGSATTASWACCQSRFRVTPSPWPKPLRRMAVPTSATLAGCRG
jgi:hypothetical protein